MDEPPDQHRKGFNPLPVFGLVLVLLMGITLWANWYKEDVTLVRYCNDQQATLERLRRILTESTPAGKEESRRPYIITAKIMFALPKDADESIEDYLERVRIYLATRCG